MKPEDIIGDMDINLEILISIGELKIDQALIRQSLESGSGKAFERLKRIVGKHGKQTGKQMLLETMASMGGKYAKESIKYADEIKGTIPDNILISVARNAFSYAFKENDLDTLSSAVSLAESLEPRTSLGPEDYQNLGRAYYAFALEESNPDKLKTAIAKFKASSKQGEEYANAMLALGLKTDDGMFEDGVKNYYFERFNPIETISIIEKFNGDITDYHSLSRLVKFIISSKNQGLISQKESYFSEAESAAPNLNERKELFELFITYSKTGNNKAINDLILKIGKQLCEKTNKEKEKFSIAASLLSINEPYAQDLASRIIGEIAKTKATFNEVFDYGAILAGDKLYAQAKELFDHALGIEESYHNLIKVGERVMALLQKPEAMPYFKKALERKAKLEEYESAGNLLLKAKLEDLAAEFYEKSLGASKEFARCKDIGNHCLQSGSKKLARRFFGYAAESAGTLEDYLSLYGGLIQDSGRGEPAEFSFILDGLDRFHLAKDYCAALEFAKNKFGADAAIKLADKLGKEREMPKAAEKLIESYKQQAEQEIESVKRRSAEMFQAAEKKRLLERIQTPIQTPIKPSREDYPCNYDSKEIIETFNDSLGYKTTGKYCTRITLTNKKIKNPFDCRMLWSKKDEY